MNPIRSRSAGLFICLWLVVSVAAVAADWPQFLGPSRDGKSAETGLISRFPADGPQVLWKRELGVGMSGFAVSNDVVFTTYQDGTSQYVIAMNSSTGATLWQSAIGEAYENAMGNGPRATPTVAGDAVFALTGEGILAALDRESGAVLWKVNVPRLLGGSPTEYGNACSPLVVGRNVIVQANGTKGRVAAFGASDGQLAWASGGKGTSGYSSPVLLNLQQTPQVVAFTGDAVLGIQPETGAELWRYPWETDYDCNTASPVQLSDQTLLISSGENHGSAILTVSRQGDSWNVESTWESLGRQSVLRAEWQTPVLLDGYLYALDNVGSAGPITNLVCVRVSDGKQMWIQPRFGKSNLVAAAGRLYLSNMNGEVIIGDASPDGFRETARHKVIETTRQAPVIANGQLYLRDDRHVVCLSVK
ncbi:MAG: PQQ-like beta-propeller repeat protein [Planctomycetaceae bacterium]|nr:PQQ-like beta-propeller repeat protein [Planctomycetaceae bacterium]